ncbi:transposase family protein [Streptomyces sp. NPDC058000]|uniref:transposase family protein n=1 Tax=Streptomyces sp. NPDC058000 TaxID=3346299 RepID=UPI0036E26C35
MGAGAKHQLVFVDQPLATLVHIRHGTTHDVLAYWFSVDRPETERDSIVSEVVRGPMPGVQGVPQPGSPAEGKRPAAQRLFVSLELGRVRRKKQQAASEVLALGADFVTARLGSAQSPQQAL